MDSITKRKLISNSFNKLHEQLSTIRTHVDSLDDPVAATLYESMEFGLLAPMRKLRVHLEIPYDWHEERPTAAEAAS